MSAALTKEAKFIWRRAFRSANRTVVRADLLEAFDISKAGASQLLSATATASEGKLTRVGYKVIAPGWAKPPSFAGETDLIEAIESGLHDFRHTGLRTEDLPINRVKWTESMPVEPGALWLIVQALVRQESVWMQYVSMRQGDTGVWRRIVPLALEKSGDQMRLTAQDIEKPDHPVRTFVLTRILKAEEDNKPIPRGFVRANARVSDAILDVKFNSRFTPQQISVLSAEIRVVNNRVKVPCESVHEFKRLFSSVEIAADIVYPTFLFNDQQ